MCVQVNVRVCVHVCILAPHIHDVNDRSAEPHPAEVPGNAQSNHTLDSTYYWQCNERWYWDLISAACSLQKIQGRATTYYQLEQHSTLIISLENSEDMAGCQGNTCTPIWRRAEGGMPTEKPNNEMLSNSLQHTSTHRPTLACACVLRQLNCGVPPILK